MKSLFGNKSAEKDIRDWLNENQYYGNSAQFVEIELHAIRRPGWLQVFRFEAKVKTVADEWVQLYGAMRSDERYGDPQMFASQQVTARDEQLATWSENMITQRPRRGS